jgi:hypothetical protein
MALENGHPLSPGPTVDPPFPGLLTISDSAVNNPG